MLLSNSNNKPWTIKINASRLVLVCSERNSNQRKAEHQKRNPLKMLNKVFYIVVVVLRKQHFVLRYEKNASTYNTKHIIINKPLLLNAIPKNRKLSNFQNDLFTACEWSDCAYIVKKNQQNPTEYTKYPNINV